MRVRVVGADLNLGLGEGQNLSLGLILVYEATVDALDSSKPIQLLRKQHSWRPNRILETICLLDSLHYHEIFVPVSGPS